MSELESWKKAPLGARNTFPGSSIKNKTGSWREFKPILDMNKCIKCMICYVSCPDGTIDPETFGIDLDHCKGCGICARICPVKAIEMVSEVI
jgi:2-oxoacid:acceptor oxidoreductase delta subunit (pyruvate/2-ketoisovalerate family)